jgi:hypothetical protein
MLHVAAGFVPVRPMALVLLRLRAGRLRADQETGDREEGCDQRTRTP